MFENIKIPGIAGIKKAALWLGGSRLFRVGVLLRSHLCHPNHKLILNNKDRKDDYKDETEQICIHRVIKISLDYMLFRK